MSILDSYPKLNCDEINRFYHYGPFSFVRQGERIRTMNNILSKIFYYIFINSEQKLSLKELLNIVYMNRNWQNNSKKFEDFFKKLYDEKLLVDSNYQCKNEITFYENSQEYWPMHVSFEVTNRCNFNCSFCYNDFSPKKEEMSTSEIENMLVKLKKHGLLSIELTGGELFVRKDIFDIIDIVYANYDYFFILTNGYLVDQAVINKLLKYKDKIKAIGVSFHSSDRNMFDRVTGVSGSYDRVLNAIKLIVDNNLLVRIACPVVDQSYDDLVNLCKLFSKIKVSSIEFGINMLSKSIISKDFKKKEKQLNEVLDQLNKKHPDLNMDVYQFGEDLVSTVKLIGCGSLSKNMVISPSGIVKPCVYFPENSIFNIGKFSSTNIASEKTHLINKFIRGTYQVNDLNINAICKNCDYYSICGHCFYVRSLINRYKENCLLSKKYGFRFDNEVKRLT